MILIIKHYFDNNSLKKIIGIGIIGLFFAFQGNTVYASDPSSWAEKEIDALKDWGIYTEAMTSDYQDQVSRAEFAELVVLTYERLVNDIDSVYNNTAPFVDTSAESIIKAYELGIIQGTDETHFSPDLLINREQMMVIYIRLIELVQSELGLTLLSTQADLKLFQDYEMVSVWAIEGIGIGISSGLMTGNQGFLSPKTLTSKEQVLLVNYRIIEIFLAIEGFQLIEKQSALETILQEGLVTCDVLNMRSEPTTERSNNVIGKLYRYNKITIHSFDGIWYYVQTVDGSYGYVHGDYIKIYEKTNNTTELRETIKETALAYIGTPYRYGGTSLTGGLDCSGFTQSLYGLFGYNIGRSGTDQSRNGQAIGYEELMVGDLVTYGYNGRINHIALYIGNGQIIHATTSAGVKVTAMIGYLNQPLIGYTRMIFVH